MGPWAGEAGHFVAEVVAALGVEAGDRTGQVEASAEEEDIGLAEGREQAGCASWLRPLPGSWLSGWARRQEQERVYEQGHGQVLWQY